MRFSARRSMFRYVGLAGLGAALLAGPAVVAPAQAAPGAAPAVVKAPCEPMTRVAPGHARHDAVDLTEAERARTEEERNRRVSARTARSAATVAQLPAHILVPVYVHVIKGSHAGEQTVNDRKIRRVMEILRAGFRGDQSQFAVATRYSFTIKKITYTRNDRWYHAALFNKADRQAKTQLHRGFSRALNLYFSGAETQGLPLLGYARFPWQYALNPKLDGVTVNVNGLPGGRATGYNLGDTVIHEVGHWLGLFHTFESKTGNGCDPINDGVTDTPAEIDANFRCSDLDNLCDPTELATKLDPALNFMDYTFDTCMRLFTAGQAARMDYEYATYRY